MSNLNCEKGRTPNTSEFNIADYLVQGIGHDYQEEECLFCHHQVRNIYQKRAYLQFKVGLPEGWTLVLDTHSSVQYDNTSVTERPHSRVTTLHLHTCYFCYDTTILLASSEHNVCSFLWIHLPICRNKGIHDLKCNPHCLFVVPKKPIHEQNFNNIHLQYFQVFS